MTPKKKGKSKPRKREPSPQESAEQDDVIRCICGDNTASQGRLIISCDECNEWQHLDCMGLQGQSPDEYFCEIHAPENHKHLLAAVERGEEPWKDNRLRAEQQKDAENSTNRPRAPRRGPPCVSCREQGNWRISAMCDRAKPCNRCQETNNEDTCQYPTARSRGPSCHACRELGPRAAAKCNREKPCNVCEASKRREDCTYESESTEDMLKRSKHTHSSNVRPHPLQQYLSASNLQRFQDVMLVSKLNYGSMQLPPTQRFTAFMARQRLRKLHHWINFAEDGSPECLAMSALAREHVNDSDNRACEIPFPAMASYIDAVAHDPAAVSGKATQIFERLPVAPWELSRQTQLWVMLAAQYGVFPREDEIGSDHTVLLPTPALEPWRTIRRLGYCVEIRGTDPDTAERWTTNCDVEVGSISRDVVIPGAHCPLRSFTDEDQDIQMIDAGGEYDSTDFNLAKNLAKLIMLEFDGVIASEDAFWEHMDLFATTYGVQTSNAVQLFDEFGVPFRPWDYSQGSEHTWMLQPQTLTRDFAFQNLYNQDEQELPPIRINAGLKRAYPVARASFDVWLRNLDILATWSYASSQADFENDQIELGEESEHVEVCSTISHPARWHLCLGCHFPRQCRSYAAPFPSHEAACTPCKADRQFDACDRNRPECTCCARRGKKCYYGRQKAAEKCDRCRKRGTRCDLAQPACGNCVASGKTCLWKGQGNQTNQIEPTSSSVGFAQGDASGDEVMSFDDSPNASEDELSLPDEDLDWLEEGLSDQGSMNEGLTGEDSVDDESGRHSNYCGDCRYVEFNVNRLKMKSLLDTESLRLEMPLKWKTVYAQLLYWTHHDNRRGKLGFTRETEIELAGRIWEDLRPMTADGKVPDAYIDQILDPDDPKIMCFDGYRRNYRYPSIEGVQPAFRGPEKTTRYHVPGNVVLTSWTINLALASFPKIYLKGIHQIRTAKTRIEEENAAELLRRLVVIDAEGYGRWAQHRIGVPIKDNHDDLEAGWFEGASMPSEKRKVPVEMAWKTLRRAVPLNTRKDISSEAKYFYDQLAMIPAVYNIPEKFKELYLRPSQDRKNAMVFCPFSGYSVFPQWEDEDCFAFFTEHLHTLRSHCDRKYKAIYSENPELRPTLNVTQLMLAVAHRYMDNIKSQLETLDDDETLETDVDFKDEGGLTPWANKNSVLCSSIGKVEPGTEMKSGFSCERPQGQGPEFFKLEECGFLWETRFTNMVKWNFPRENMEVDPLTQLDHIRIEESDFPEGAVRPYKPGIFYVGVSPIIDEMAVQIKGGDVETSKSTSKGKHTDASPYRPTSKPKFSNMGRLNNTCYLSGPLQALFHIAELRHIVQQKCDFRLLTGRGLKVLESLDDPHGKKLTAFRGELSALFSSLLSSKTKTGAILTRKVLEASAALNDLWIDEIRDAGEYYVDVLRWLNYCCDSSTHSDDIDTQGTETEKLETQDRLNAAAGSPVNELRDSSTEHFRAFRRSGNMSSLTDLLSIQFAIESQCPVCDTCDRRFEYHWTLPVKMPALGDESEEISMQQLLDDRFSPNPNEGETCPHCQQKPQNIDEQDEIPTRLGDSFCRIVRAPRLLAIQIDRGVYDETLRTTTARKTRLNRLSEIDIKAWSKDIDLPSRSIHPETFALAGSTKYRPIGVLGFIDPEYATSHYVCHIREGPLNEGSWMRFDDTEREPSYQNPEYERNDPNYCEALIWYRRIDKRVEMADQAEQLELSTTDKAVAISYDDGLPANDEGFQADDDEGLILPADDTDATFLNFTIDLQEHTPRKERDRFRNERQVLLGEKASLDKQRAEIQKEREGIQKEREGIQNEREEIREERAALTSAAEKYDTSVARRKATLQDAEKKIRASLKTLQGVLGAAGVTPRIRYVEDLAQATAQFKAGKLFLLSNPMSQLKTCLDAIQDWEGIDSALNTVYNDLLSRVDQDFRGQALDLVHHHLVRPLATGSAPRLMYPTSGARQQQEQETPDVGAQLTSPSAQRQEQEPAGQDAQMRPPPLLTSTSDVVILQSTGLKPRTKGSAFEKYRSESPTKDPTASWSDDDGGGSAQSASKRDFDKVWPAAESVSPLRRRPRISSEEVDATALLDRFALESADKSAAREQQTLDTAATPVLHASQRMSRLPLPLQSSATQRPVPVLQNPDAKLAKVRAERDATNRGQSRSGIPTPASPMRRSAPPPTTPTRPVTSTRAMATPVPPSRRVNQGYPFTAVVGERVRVDGQHQYDFQVAGAGTMWRSAEYAQKYHSDMVQEYHDRQVARAKQTK